MKTRLKIYKGTCGCRRTAILAEGMKVEIAASEKHAAALLRKAFTSDKIHYATHYRGRHVLFGYFKGHWYPHINSCKRMGCSKY